MQMHPLTPDMLRPSHPQIMMINDENQRPILETSQALKVSIVSQKGRGTQRHSRMEDTKHGNLQCRGVQPCPWNAKMPNCKANLYQKQWRNSETRKHRQSLGIILKIFEGQKLSESFPRYTRILKSCR